MPEENTEIETKKPKKIRIGGPEAAVLVLFAIFFDLLSIIPIVNDVIVFIAQGLIAIFFFIHGVSVFSTKKVIPYVLAFIIEAIPAISIIPAITLETIIIIFIVRMEDETGLSVSSPTLLDKLRGGVK